MTIYEKHFKTKQKIEALEAELKELESQIFEEVKGLSTPMRTGFGTYTTVSRKIITYSQNVETAQKLVAEKIKEVSKPLEDLKAQEVEQGIAKIKEVQSLRFTANRDKAAPKSN